MRSTGNHPKGMNGDPNWDFYLPDDEFPPDESLPEPGDFWIEPDFDE